MKRLLLFTMILSMGMPQMFSQEATSLRTRLFSSEMQLKSANVDVDYKYIPKSPGHYSAEDWHEVLDSMYGPGLPTADKLAIFDEVWQTIDEKFAGFHCLDLDWDAVRDEYRPRVADTDNPISQGRFIAILNHMLLPLKSMETSMEYKDISYFNSYPLQERHGLPIFNCTGRVYNKHFGASLTALDDSTLLVFKALSNHPIGLVPGDIILGYDGIPWISLYKEMQNAELLLEHSWLLGDSEYQRTHNFLTSAGMNWHLFDTIDVVKYSTGDTMHYATKLLAGQDRLIVGNEQLKIDGVSWPDTLTGEISWGLLDGTNIGYIYALGSSNDAKLPFYNAIDSLMHHHKVDGLIIDVRADYGGRYENYNSGLSLLFNENVKSIKLHKRCTDPNDHFKLCEMPHSYDIPADKNTYYYKPIAVLTGPGVTGAGAHLVNNLAKHPKVKTFGKKTMRGYASFASHVITGKSDWKLYYASLISSPSANNSNYNFRTLLAPDSTVWLTQEATAQGIDNVVKAAVEWIGSITIEPEKVTNPKPDNGVCGEDYTMLKLSWTPGENTSSFNIYFSKDSTIDTLDFVKNTDKTFETVDELERSTTYYWRVDAVSGERTAVGDVWSFKTKGENIALNKPVVASSEYGLGLYYAIDAVDGDVTSNSSRWWPQAGASYPHWLKVDLGDSYKITSFKIFTGTSGYNSPLNDFKFQYHDGIEWVDAYSTLGNTEAAKYVKLENPISGVDSVRLWVTKSFEDKVRLYEFEVYGESDVAVQSARSSDFELYPNPTTHTITLKTQMPEKASIKIIQLNGQEIYQTTMNGNMKIIDLSQFPPGIYFITIKSDDYIWTKRFVKL